MYIQRKMCSIKSHIVFHQELEPSVMAAGYALLVPPEKTMVHKHHLGTCFPGPAESLHACINCKCNACYVGSILHLHSIQGEVGSCQIINGKKGSEIGIKLFQIHIFIIY